MSDVPPNWTLGSVPGTALGLVEMEGNLPIAYPITSYRPLPVTVSNPTPQGLTNTELRAAPLAVTVTFPATQAVSGPLTNTELRATPVPVSGAFYPATQPVSGSVALTHTTSNPVPTREVLLDLSGSPLTPTITTTAQTLSTFAASLFAGGATAVAVYAVGAVLPILGTLTLPSVTGSVILSPSGRTLITQAEAAVMSLKVALTSTQVVIYGYR